MNSKDTIKALIPVWGIPLGIVITVRLFTPDPGQTKNDFPSVVFTPSKIEMLEKQGSKRSNFFEVWLHNPDGTSYHHRDPESELHRRIPVKTPLKISFSPTEHGNVLMDVAIANSKEASILSFADVMAEYAARQRLVYIIAGIWLVLGNLFLFGLWKERLAERPSY